MGYDGLQLKSYLAKVKKTLDKEHKPGKMTKMVILKPLGDLRFSENNATNNQMRMRFCNVMIRLAEAKAKEANDRKKSEKTGGYKPHEDSEETETPDPGPNLEPTRTIAGNSKGFKAVIGLVERTSKGKNVEARVEKQCKDIADGITQLANRLTDETIQSEFSELNRQFDDLTRLLRAKMNPQNNTNTATAEIFKNSEELATAYDLLLQRLEDCFRLQKQKNDRVNIAKIQNNNLYNEKEKKRQIDEIEEASKRWLKNKLLDRYETLYTSARKPEKDDDGEEEPKKELEAQKVTIQNLGDVLSEFPDMESDRHREAIELYMNLQKQIAAFKSAGNEDKAQLFIKASEKARKAYEAQRDDWDDLYRDMHPGEEPPETIGEEPPETPDGLVFDPNEDDDDGALYSLRMNNDYIGLDYTPYSKLVKLRDEMRDPNIDDTRKKELKKDVEERVAKIVSHASDAASGEIYDLRDDPAKAWNLIKPYLSFIISNGGTLKKMASTSGGLEMNLRIFASYLLNTLLDKETGLAREWYRTNLTEKDQRNIHDFLVAQGYRDLLFTPGASLPEGELLKSIRYYLTGPPKTIKEGHLVLNKILDALIDTERKSSTFSKKTREAIISFLTHLNPNLKNNLDYEEQRKVDALLKAYTGEKRRINDKLATVDKVSLGPISYKDFDYRNFIRKDWNGNEIGFGSTEFGQYLTNLMRDFLSQYKGCEPRCRDDSLQGDGEVLRQCPCGRSRHLLPWNAARQPFQHSIRRHISAEESRWSIQYRNCFP